MSNLSVKTVKSLFIIILIFLPLQYAMVGIVGFYSSEPWPAFVFPGFKSIYVYGDNYQINQFIVEVETGETRIRREFTPQQFFYEIPNSQVAGFLRSNFDTTRGSETLETATRQWVRERARELVDTPAGDIYYLQRRCYMSRRDNNGLTTDSVKVINRLLIAEGVSHED